MSKEDVKAIKSAYEKMLEDGTANKKIDMSMMVEPDVSTIEGLGDQIEDQSPFPRERQPEQEQEQEQFDHTDYSKHDSYIEQRISSLRNKMNEKKGIKTSGGGALSKANREIASLKKRVEKLEEALMLIMETHENLLG